MSMPADQGDTIEGLAVLSSVAKPRVAAQLPLDPVIKIRPASFWERIDFSELWAHREVLYFLIWRDLKVRYKQTILGAAWVVVQPVLMTLVFAVFLGSLIKVPSDGVPYPLFAFSGLLLWTFVSNAVLSSCYSLVTNAQIITRVYFSRLMIPAATVGVRLVDLIVAATILVGLMIYYRMPLSLSILLLPLFIIQIAVLVLAIGILAAALNVRYRDVGTMAPILLQVWMFVSPLVYSSSIVPARLRLLYSLNPLVGIIDGFRAALFNLPLPWVSIGISVAATLPLLVFAARVFRKLESSFADEI
ncbi:MAG: ABC transporter permease [Pyrinomonadaceae bacterium]